MRKTFLLYTALLCLLLPVLNNCSLFKPKFDPVGHQYAITIQKDALALMDRAEESFTLYREEVYRLMTRVERAYEHARPLYKNQKVTNIWDALRNPQGNRLGRFMQEWEKEDTLGDLYIKETKEMLAEDFKLLVEIEEGKEK
jgi:hypothetical protein